MNKDGPGAHLQRYLSGANGIIEKTMVPNLLASWAVSFFNPAKDWQYNLESSCKAKERYLVIQGGQKSNY